MKLSHICKLLTAAALAFASTQQAFAGEMTEGVQVTVSKRPFRGGTVRYSYTVSNMSGSPITTIQLGYDHLHGVAEFTTPPYRWVFGKPVSRAVVGGPANWIPFVVPTEGTPYFDVEWVRNPKKAPLPSGRSAGGFSILIRGEDAKYETAHWRVVLQDGTVRVGIIQPAP